VRVFRRYEVSLPPPAACNGKVYHLRHKNYAAVGVFLFYSIAVLTLWSLVV
jgi:hypothetical protein